MIYHFEKQDEENDHDKVVCQYEFITEIQRTYFVDESSRSVVSCVWSRATVAGKEWLESYCDGLTKICHDKNFVYDSIVFLNMKTSDENKSIHRLNIPANLDQRVQ